MKFENCPHLINGAKIFGQDYTNCFKAHPNLRKSNSMGPTIAHLIMTLTHKIFV